MRYRNLAVLAVAGTMLAACPNPLQVVGNGAGPANSAGPASTAERDAIQRVLDADNRAGTSSSDPRQIYAQMQRIDLNGTPVEFRNAYQAHMDAWRETGALLDEGAAMTDADEARRRDWTDRAGRAEGRISDTFNVVSRIAARYGASPPASSGRSGLGGTIDGRGGNGAAPAPAPAPQDNPPPSADKPTG